MGPEVAQRLLDHTFAAYEISQNTYIAQPPQGAEQAAYRQSDYLVSGSRYALHLHPALGTHEEDFYIGVRLAQSSCYAHGREDVASRAATAYYDSEFFHI